MSAVDNLLNRLSSIDAALAALSTSPATSAAVSDHLMRGIAVHGLIAVESFLKERMLEWSATLAAARIPPGSLPGGTTLYENRVLEVLPKRIRDAEYSNSAHRSLLLQEIGHSLTSLYSGTFMPHHMAFMWAGSNIRASDVEAIVSLVGTPTDKVWGALTRIWQQVDKYAPGNASFKTVFELLCELRHAAAHQSSPAIPLPHLRSTPRNAKLVCLCIDVAVSRNLKNISGLTSRRNSNQLLIRRIVKDGNRWPEYGPGRQTAVKRHPSLAEALQASITRASTNGELILVTDRAEDILDWRFPV